MRCPRPLSSLLLILCVSLVWPGCATTGAKKKVQAVAPQPAAARWAEDARALPLGSPAVVVARLDQLTRGADALMGWYTRDPQMFTARGERRRALAGELRAALGALALNRPEGWRRMGLDPARRVLAGAYPLGPAARGALGDAEAIIRTRARAAEGEALSVALGRLKVAPSGLHQALAARLGDADARGMRVILPTQDADAARQRLDELARRLELAVVVRDHPGGWVRIWRGEDEDEPLVALRKQPGQLVLDVWQRSGVPEGAEAQAVVASVTARVASARDGLPAAPSPHGAPAMALALDHERAAQVLFHGALRDALATTAQEAVSQRDEALLAELREIAEGMQHWTQAPEQVHGLSYALRLDDPQRVAALDVTLHGKRGLELPATPTLPTLGIASRSVGAGLAAEVLFGASWQRWAGARDAGLLMRSMDRADASPLSSGLFLLSLPRNLLMFVVSFERIIAEVAPLDLIALYRQRAQLARVEVTTHGDLSGFQLRPHLIGLVVAREGVSARDREWLGRGLRELMLWAVEDHGRPETQSEEVNTETPLVANAWTTMGVPKDHPLAGASYYWARDAKTPWLLFGLNVPADALERERLALLARAPTRADAALVRVEPGSLVRLLSTYQQLQLTDYHAHILAQRLGPVQLRLRPIARGDAREITYTVELLPPPHVR